MTYRTAALVMTTTALVAGCTGTGTDSAAVNIDRVAADHDHVIRYTDDGFDPDRLTVSPGDSVAWVRSGPDMWIASNSHPTHADYGLDRHGDPIFDQAEHGTLFTFTFNETGEWQYHNHMNAYHHGMVVVEED